MKSIQMKSASESGIVMLEITIKIDEEHAEELVQLGKRLVEAIDKLEQILEEDDAD